ncbi:MAG TPA: hypothetical protein PLA68_01635 [Panacibacter sp.]|nr:hypothetical protein [Panacibacter sp.]
MNIGETIYAYSPLQVQNLIISAYGFRWRKRRFGGIFKAEYLKAKERENFTAAQWKTYENEQLKKIVLHAFDHVPYYKTSFEKHGLNRGSLENISTDTIAQLPLLSKEDVRLHGTGSLLAGLREKKGRFFASSGSTGTPTQILYSHSMHQRWFALFEGRVRNWAAVSSSEARGMIGGRRVLPAAKNTTPFFRYNAFEKQVYFSAYHINAANAADYAEGMTKHHIRYLTGYAMSNFLLARFLKEQHIKAPQLKAVITSSEKLTDEMRLLFKEVYGCKTYDGWSGVEACALISECEHGSLHISPDAGLIEVLDNHLQPVKPGTAGTVYCTGFINYDQPLIRYNMGDQIILSENICTCGRAMPVVKEILGRTEDIVIGRDGREMVRFHSVFNGLKSVKQAQVIQQNTGTLIINVVVDEKLCKEEEILIRKRIQSQLGEIDITIKEVSEIPLNKNGKFQAVISSLKR